MLLLLRAWHALHPVEAVNCKRIVFERYLFLKLFANLLVRIVIVRESMAQRDASAKLSLLAPCDFEIEKVRFSNCACISRCPR